MTNIPSYATLFGCSGLFLLVLIYNVYVGIKCRLNAYQWMCIVAMLAAVAMLMVIPIWVSLVDLNIVL